MSEDLCSVAFTATAVRGRAKFVQLFNECIRLAGSYRPLPLLILPLSVPPSLCRSISVFLSLPALLSLSLSLSPSSTSLLYLLPTSLLSLQVGAHVDVTQPDGQVLTANIVKLTDQSTYTVGKLYITLVQYCVCVE